MLVATSVSAQFRGFRLIPLSETSPALSAADFQVRCAALYQYLSVFDGGKREEWADRSAVAKARALANAQAEMPSREADDILQRINMLIVARSNDYVATIFDADGDAQIIDKDLASCADGGVS